MVFFLCVLTVHGTWVSDKKLKPWDRVKLKEGDTLRIGGSSRVYRLHWIPMSQAYNSASDVPMEEEKEHESAGTEDENSMDVYKVRIPCLSNYHIESQWILTRLYVEWLLVLFLFSFYNVVYFGVIVIG